MKLDSRAIALLEDPAHEQAVIDFLAKLAVPSLVSIPATPPAAFLALERARAERLQAGRPGWTSLRVDDAPGRSPSWRVIAGDMVVATSKTWKETA